MDMKYTSLISTFSQWCDTQNNFKKMQCMWLMYLSHFILQKTQFHDLEISLVMTISEQQNIILTMQVAI